MARCRRQGPWLVLILGVVLAHAVFLAKVTPWVQGTGASHLPQERTSAPSLAWQLVSVPQPRASHPPQAVKDRPPAPQAEITPDEPTVAPDPATQAPAEAPEPPAPEASAPPDEQGTAEAAPTSPPATPLADPPAATADPFEADLQQQAPWPTAPPPSRHLNYTVMGHYSGFPLVASAFLQWDNQGDRYQAQAEISLLGFTATQKSRGLLGPQGLSPVRFSDKRRSEIAAHFNAEKQLITYSANTPDAPLRLLQQDQLSVFIQLAAWVAADPAHFGPGTRITVPVSSARGPDFWLFSVDGPEDLALADKRPLPTLKLHRVLQKETDTAGEVWLAPSLQYLPARIKLTDAKGNVVDQTVDP